MEVGVLSLFAGAIVAKAAADAWFSGSFDRAVKFRSGRPQAEDARGGFLRTLR
jgi:hypothetical protein